MVKWLVYPVIPTISGRKDHMQKELVEDLIAITTSFSARIYGQRGGKKVTAKIKSILGVNDDENGTHDGTCEPLEGV